MTTHLRFALFAFPRTTFEEWASDISSSALKRSGVVLLAMVESLDKTWNKTLRRDVGSFAPATVTAPGFVLSVCRWAALLSCKGQSWRNRRRRWLSGQSKRRIDEFKSWDCSRTWRWVLTLIRKGDRMSFNKEQKTQSNTYRLIKSVQSHCFTVLLLKMHWTLFSQWRS